MRPAWAPPFPRSPLWLRAIGSTALYAAMALEARRVARPSLILSLTDPPLISALGVRLARRHRVPHVFWCQDLYPEVAEAAGVLDRFPETGRLLHRWADEVLRASEAVVVPGRDLQARLAGRMPQRRLPECIPNWPEAAARPEPDPSGIAAIRRQLAPADGRLMLYSGNLGRAHEFDTLLDAFGRIDASSRWHLAIVGSGPRLEEVRRRAAALPRVTLHPPFPSDRLAALLQAADCHVVTLRPEFAGLVVPSKIYPALACSRPVLYLGPAESECAWLLEETGAGLRLPNGQPEAIVRWLREMESDPARLDRFAAAAAANGSHDRLRHDSLTALSRLLGSISGPSGSRLREPS